MHKLMTILMPDGSKWQPIETAPKDGSEFVVCNMNKGGIKNLVSWNMIHGYWQSKGSYYYRQDTHWFPLPDNPNPI